MNTPAVKVKGSGPKTRKRLTKVVKKTEKGLNSSQKFYLKKKKLAINTSLNSSQTLSSLKVNNKHLAHGIQKLKCDLRLLHNANSELREENHQLRQQVIHYENTIRSPQKIIDDEVNKAFSALTSSIRRKLRLVDIDLKSLFENVLDLTKLCSRRSSSLSVNLNTLSYLNLPLDKSQEKNVEISFQNTSVDQLELPMQNTDVDLSLITEESAINSTVLAPSDFGYLESLKEIEDSNFDNTEKQLLLPTRVPVENQDSAGIESVSPYCHPEKDEYSSFRKASGDSSPSRKRLFSSTDNKKKSKRKHSLHLLNESDLQIKHQEHHGVVESSKEGDITSREHCDMELTQLSKENSYHLSLNDVQVNNELPLQDVKNTLTNKATTQEVVVKKIPDAVACRMTKPGNLNFAVSRRESDGTRKNVPVVTKARSKSKKEIAEKIKNLPQGEPSSIFDFHEKTPKFDKIISDVYDLSAEQSSFSPPCFTDKQIESTKNSLLGLGEVYFQPLKDSPDISNVVTKRKRSKSRTRSQCKNDDEKDISTTNRTRSRSSRRKEETPTDEPSLSQRSRSLSRSKVIEDENILSISSPSTRPIVSIKQLNQDIVEIVRKSGIAEHQDPSLEGGHEILVDSQVPKEKPVRRGRSRTRRFEQIEVREYRGSIGISPEKIPQELNLSPTIDVQESVNTTDRKLSEDKEESTESVFLNGKFDSKCSKRSKSRSKHTKLSLKSSTEAHGNDNSNKDEVHDVIIQDKEARSSSHLLSRNYFIPVQASPEKQPKIKSKPNSECEGIAQKSPSKKVIKHSKPKSHKKAKMFTDDEKQLSENNLINASTDSKSAGKFEGSPKKKLKTKTRLTDYDTENYEEYPKKKLKTKTSLVDSDILKLPMKSFSNNFHYNTFSPPRLKVDEATLSPVLYNKPVVWCKQSEGWTQKEASDEKRKRNVVSNERKKYKLKKSTSPRKDSDLDSKSGATSSLEITSSTKPQLKKDQGSPHHFKSSTECIEASNNAQSASPRTFKQAIKESIDLFGGGRRRRAATNCNYVEPHLNSKLRRGDPFTSQRFGSENVQIFKSPKNKNRISSRKSGKKSSSSTLLTVSIAEDKESEAETEQVSK